MKTRKLLLLLALAAATTGMQAQRIKGSDTVLPIAQQTAERFMTLNPSSPRHRDRWWNRCRYFSPAGPDPRTSPWLPAPSSSAKRWKPQSCRRRLGRSSHRLRCPCRSGSPLQPSETTDPATTGRHLSGAKSPTGSNWVETTAKS